MAFGYTQALIIKEAAAYGEQGDLSTGSVYVLPVRLGVDLKLNKTFIKTEHMRAVGTILQPEEQNGIEGVEGSFSGVVPWGARNGTGFNAFSVLLKHLLGAVTTPAPSGTTYTHTYNWNDKAFTGLTIGMLKGNALYVYDGCQIASIEFTCKVGGPLEYKCNVVGKTLRVVAAITAPTLTLEPTAGNQYVLGQQMAFEVDDVVEPITEMTWTISNELGVAEDQSYALGGLSRVNLAKIGHMAEGTVTRRHDKDSGETSKFFAKFLSGATAKLEAIFTHPTDADFSLKFQFGIVKYRGEDPNPETKGYMMEKAPFTAFDLNTSASNFVVQTDEYAGPVTATGAYDGSGT